VETTPIMNEYVWVMVKGMC